MAEAMVYDAIRTPRGRGKSSGSLHEVKPISLLTGVLKELQKRHDLDTAQVDDVVMGCVTPVGEQGSCIAKTAALAAGWDYRASGVQLNRFCASGPGGGEHGGAESALGLGRPGGRRRRRIHVARAAGHRPRPLGLRSGDRVRHRVHPAGHQRRPDRDAGRLHARAGGCLRAALAAARGRGARRRPLQALAGAGGRRHRRRDPRPRRVHPAADHAWKASPR